MEPQFLPNTAGKNIDTFSIASAWNWTLNGYRENKVPRAGNRKGASGLACCSRRKLKLHEAKAYGIRGCSLKMLEFAPVKLL